jgi:hypothetical protein
MANIQRRIVSPSPSGITGAQGTVSSLLRMGLGHTFLDYLRWLYSLYLSTDTNCCIIEIWNLNILIGNPKMVGLSDTLIFGLII